uniref:Uncharacterized protein n=1 Tax=Laticauda laticaudata TaxID=8630 RepID=A0A8C5SYA2_LATLA
MFGRGHLAPARLAKMYPNTKAECWKCKYKEGTLFHMWWQCSEVKKYWIRVQRWLLEITVALLTSHMTASQSLSVCLWFLFYALLKLSELNLPGQNSLEMLLFL